MFNKLYKEILEAYGLPEILNVYITKNTIRSPFIQNILKDNPDWIFDNAEILDFEPIEVHEYLEKGNHIEPSFGFSYILTLWSEMPSEWKCIDWSNLNKFEVYIMNWGNYDVRNV